MTFLLAFSTLAVSPGADMAGGQAYAASVKNAKTSLSRKTVRIKTGSSATVKLRNARARVKWTIGDRNRAAVRSTKGSRHNTVVIRAGQKTGETYLKARCKGKVYKCRVIVSKPAKGGGSQDPEGDDREIEILELSDTSADLAAGIGRNDVTKQASSAFIRAAGDFSFDILKKTMTAGDSTDVSGQYGSMQNILISPDSVMTALAMLENGARGATLEEMEDVLSGGMSAGDFNEYLAGMNDRLAGSGNIIFNKANSIWARDGDVNVVPDFVKINKQYHDAAYYKAPFDDETASDMNKWVYNNSRNMIDKIIDRLDASDRMVLINTIAFEGKWAVPFNGSYDGEFTAADGSRQAAKMLGDTDRYSYIELKGGRGFVRNYAGGEIAFVGILPPEGMDIDKYVESLTGSDYINAWNSRESRMMRIGLPEFSYDYSVSMADPLRAMGIQKAFTSEADLSGMYRPSAGTPSLYVDDVLHKTHIELDNNGTKAAAATAVIAKAGSAFHGEVTQVILDRPFLYALTDTTTGLPLFIGVVKTAAASR